MVNQQILDYINQQNKEGASKEDIKSALLSSGWTSEDIEEAFSSIASPQAPQQTRAPSPDVLLDTNAGEVFHPTSPDVSSTVTPAFAGIGTLISSTWSIYKSRFWVLFAITIIPFIATFLYGVSIGLFLALGVPIIIILAINFILKFLLFVIGSWSIVALLYATKDNEEKIGFVESFRRGWGKILSYWWVVILSSLIFVSGIVFFIIPGILFIIWFFAAPFVLVSENTRGMDALMKSKEYVKGRWWGVFGRMLVLLIPILIFYLTEIIFLVISGFPKDSLAYNRVVLFVQVINLFILPFAVVYIFSIYQSLKESRGEFVFDSKKGRTKFIVFAVLGVILILLGIFSYIVVLNFKCCS